MSIRRTTQIGNPVLRRKAKAVPAAAVTSVPVRKIVRDLVDSMREYDLVGMAAPQIGVGVRIFVSEIRTTPSRRNADPDGLRVFINPAILRRSVKTAKGGEGCGSVAYAGLFAEVRRPEGVVVSAYDEKGKRFTMNAHGLLARVIQHEYDHLEGRVFLDRLADMKGLMSREEYLKRQ